MVDKLVINYCLQLELILLLRPKTHSTGLVELISPTPVNCGFPLYKEFVLVRDSC